MNGWRYYQSLDTPLSISWVFKLCCLGPGKQGCRARLHTEVHLEMIPDPGTSPPLPPDQPLRHSEKGQSFSGLWVLCSQNIDWDQQLIHPWSSEFLIGTWSFCVCFVCFFWEICWSPRRPCKKQIPWWSSDGGFWNERSGSSCFISIGDHWQEEEHWTQRVRHLSRSF